MFFFRAVKRVFGIRYHADTFLNYTLITVLNDVLLFLDLTVT
jgi:hypothetical protein